MIALAITVNTGVAGFTTLPLAVLTLVRLAAPALATTTIFEELQLPAVAVAVSRTYTVPLALPPALGITAVTA